MDSRDTATVLIFDARAPRGLSQEEHLGGFLTPENVARSADGVPPKGFEGYLLQLADKCKGFRAVVVGPTIAQIMRRYVKGFIYEERSRYRPRVGTWRGYPVYVDDALDEPIDEYHSAPRIGGRLTATSTGPPIGLLNVVNWEGFF